MSKEKYQAKIEQIRERLLGDDVTIEEMARMQVQVDQLERGLSDAYDFHHHDTNEHHDHVGILDPSTREVLEQTIQPIRAALERVINEGRVAGR